MCKKFILILFFLLFYSKDEKHFWLKGLRLMDTFHAILQDEKINNGLGNR